MHRWVFVLMLAATVAELPLRDVRAASLEWTCPHDGRAFQFAPGDHAYMQDFASRHLATHGSSGGYPSGPGMTGDPFLDLAMPLIEQGSRALGEALARSLFGDPVEDQRREAMRQAEMERLAEIERQRRAEEERRRREMHQRLLSEMVTLGSSADLPFLGLEGDAARSSAPFDGGAGGDLPLLGLDEELAPAGTDFFGLGGGSSVSPPPGMDAAVVDLRDLRRAVYLVQIAEQSPPEERAILIDEAVRAASGDPSLLSDAPAGVTVPEASDKLIALQTANGLYREAQDALLEADGRRVRASEAVGAASRALREARAELDRRLASGAEPSSVEEARAIVRALADALEHRRRHHAEAERDAELAREAYEWTGWGRRQLVISAAGAPGEAPSDAQRASRSKLERIYRRKIDVPMPEIGGWVVRAENGRRAMETVDRMEEDVSRLTGVDPQAAAEPLERMRRKARMMQHYDQIINAQTRDRVASMARLEEARSEAQETKQQLVENAIESLEGAVGEFRKAGQSALQIAEFAALNEALDLNDELASARGLQSDLAALRDAAAGQSLDRGKIAQLTQRAGDLAAQIAEAHGLLVQRYGAEEAKQILGRSATLFKTGISLARMANDTLDIVALEQETERLSEGLGAAARGQDLHRLYRRQVDEFHQERRALEGWLAETRHRGTRTASAAERSEPIPASPIGESR